MLFLFLFIRQYTKQYTKPIRGRKYKAAATETVVPGSIPGRIKSKTVKIGIHSFLA